MALRYEVDADNAVRVFHADSDVALLFQPDWPNQTPWADAAEAAAWAELYIASVEDGNAPYAPNGPGQAGKAKLTADQKTAIATAQAAVDAAQSVEDYQTARAAFDAVISAI
jgi:hypothetical protein